MALQTNDDWFLVPADPENQPEFLRVRVSTVPWCRDLIGMLLDMGDGKQGKVENITPIGGTMAFALVSVQGEDGYRGVDLDLAGWQVTYGSNVE